MPDNPKAASLAVPQASNNSSRVVRAGMTSCYTQCHRHVQYREQFCLYKVLSWSSGRCGTAAAATGIALTRQHTVRFLDTFA